MSNTPPRNGAVDFTPFPENDEIDFETMASAMERQGFPSPTPPAETEPATGAGAGATGEASAAAAGDALPPPQPSERPISTEPPVTEWTVPLPTGETITLTRENMDTLLGLNQWAEGLTPQQRADLFAVEQGQSIAVTRDDFRAFEQWRAQQAAAPSPPPPPAPPAFDLSTLEDPQAARAVQALNEEITALRGQLTELSQRPDPRSIVAENEIQRSRIDADTQVINSVGAQYAAELGLSLEELESLYAVAAENHLLGNHVTPGQPLTTNPNAVRRTLEQASWLSPQVRSKLIQSQAADQLAQERAAAAEVDAKKARASSLASVPSAAHAVPLRDPDQVATPQQQTAEIAQFIRELGVSAEA